MPPPAEDSVWNGSSGILCGAQPLETRRYPGNRLQARHGLCYQAGEPCPEVHLRVGHTVEAQGEHRPGGGMDHQRHLGHQDTESSQEGPEHTVPGARPGSVLHQTAQSVHCRDRRPECRHCLGSFAEKRPRYFILNL
uniref:Uncharacterized protein n=1 Tax=Micrurus lemniscatus lemniscatus TaxID=129467 RepID=A0A2D4JQA1_MICLE